MDFVVGEIGCKSEALTVDGCSLHSAATHEQPQVEGEVSLGYKAGGIGADVASLSDCLLFAQCNVCSAFIGEGLRC